MIFDDGRASRAAPVPHMHGEYARPSNHSCSCTVQDTLQYAFTTSCGHSFCGVFVTWRLAMPETPIGACLVQQLERENHCPLCRESVLSASPAYTLRAMAERTQPLTLSEEEKQSVDGQLSHLRQTDSLKFLKDVCFLVYLCVHDLSLRHVPSSSFLSQWQLAERARLIWARQNTQSMLVGFLIGFVLYLYSDGDAMTLVQAALVVAAFAAVFSMLSPS